MFIDLLFRYICFKPGKLWTLKRLEDSSKSLTLSNGLFMPNKNSLYWLQCDEFLCISEINCSEDGSWVKLYKISSQNWQSQSETKYDFQGRASPLPQKSDIYLTIHICISCRWTTYKAYSKQSTAILLGAMHKMLFGSLILLKTLRIKQQNVHNCLIT